MTLYYLLKWLPKIVSDMGFSPSAAGGVLVWTNLGGAAGALALSLSTRRIGLGGLVIGALLLSALTVALFGQLPANLTQLSLMAAAAGFCTSGAVVGLFGLVADYYPAQLRAGGTGFVIGLGRGGAALGPVIAGFLFNGGAGLGLVSIAMGGAALVAAGAVIILRQRA
jgi:MFS family permease